MLLHSITKSLSCGMRRSDQLSCNVGVWSCMEMGMRCVRSTSKPDLSSASVKTDPPTVLRRYRTEDFGIESEAREQNRSRSDELQICSIPL